MMITTRPAKWPQDVASLSTLDTGFTTERIYRPIRDELSFRLVTETVHPPLHKLYEFHPSDPAQRRNWDCAVIADDDGALVGFAAAQHVVWNNRVVLWDLYVTPCYRRTGIGSQLLEMIDAFAASVHARCLWLETQNVNYPAIQFYRSCGFEFCGYDESLYDPDGPMHEEVALFFMRPVNTTPIHGPAWI